MISIFPGRRRRRRRAGPNISRPQTNKPETVTVAPVRATSQWGGLHFILSTPINTLCMPGWAGLAVRIHLQRKQYTECILDFRPITVRLVRHRAVIETEQDLSGS